MKRYILIVAAAALVVSCSKTYDTKPVSQQEISFGTWAETLTKARATANDNTAFQAGDVFDVYGFKTVGGANKQVFNGDDVTATVSGSTVTWDYTPHRFWDPAAASYTFFAALPANKLATAPWETGLFVSNDIVFDDPKSFTNDILVADKTVVNGTGDSAPYAYTNPVQINFNHIASCVDLLVKQDNTLGNAEVKVTALSLLNISNKGAYEVTAYSTNVPTVTWDEADEPTTLGTAGVYTVNETFPITVSGKTTYSEHAASSTAGEAATIFSGYVFKPQTLVADTQKIKLSYTIKVGDEEPNTYTDIVFDINKFQQTDTDNNSGTDITAWEPKTKYIYTITIGANDIQFTAAVKDWENTVNNGYHYLLN